MKARAVDHAITTPPSAATTLPCLTEHERAMWLEAVEDWVSGRINDTMFVQRARTYGRGVIAANAVRTLEYLQEVKHA